MAEKRTKIILEASDKTRRAFDSAKAGLQGVGSAAQGASRLLATFGVGLSLAGIVALATKSFKTAEALVDLSDALGIGTGQLQSFQYAADLVGVSQNDLQTALQNLSKKIGDASRGNKDAAQSFSDLGIKILDASGKTRDTGDVYRELAGKINETSDANKKASVAAELFGKTGVKVVNALSPEFLRLADDAKRVGAVIDDDVLRSMSASKDKAEALSRVLSAQLTTAFSNLSPIISKAAEWFVYFSEKAAAAYKSVQLYDINTQLDTANAKFDALSKQIEIKKNQKWNPFADIQIENLRKRLDEARAEIAKFQNERNNVLFPPPGSRSGGGAESPIIDPDLESRLKANAAYVKNLNEQAATLGMSKEAAELYKASQMGLNAEQMRSVEIYLDKIERQKEAEEGLKDLIKAEEEANSAAIAGKQILIGLEKDFRVEIEKRKLALNAPLLSSSERDLAENLLDVTKRAQDARTQIEKMYVDGSVSAATYAQRLAEITDLEAVQTEAVKELAAEQDKLNGSWQHGAKVALGEYLDDVSNVSKKTQQLFTDAFRSAEDALVDFVKTGKLDFKSLADSIITDLIRIQVQKGLAQVASAALSFFGFADGGIMTPDGALSLQKYASGGIATSPQLALFGEGRMNEAFVPLPDGRSIPVTMRGGTGSQVITNVTVNISQGGAQTDVQGNASQLGRTIANLVSGEIMRQQRPGGLLSG